MKTDEQLINEIEEHIRETDYPGSSLNCGVQPIGVNDNYAVFYYPKENCIMKQRQNPPRRSSAWTAGSPRGG